MLYNTLYKPLTYSTLGKKGKPGLCEGLSRIRGKGTGGEREETGRGMGGEAGEKYRTGGGEWRGGKYGRMRERGAPAPSSLALL